jgi:hypothetical protein
MTDLMERAEVDEQRPHRQRVLRDPAGACTNKRHGASKTAWNVGCRCPAAIKAHDEYEARRRVTMPAQVDESGRCVAAKHGSAAAYKEAGCRCPTAVVRREEVRQAVSIRNAARRARQAIPRGRWRAPNMRVDRTNLRLLLSGFVDSPTVGEKNAAVAILSKRGGRTGLYNSTEIAQRIGVDPNTVRSISARIKRLAETRAERRLADVKYKARLVARAREKKATRA